MRFCTKCGKEVGPADKVCRHCGNRLVPVQDSRNAVPPVENRPYTPVNQTPVNSEPEPNDSFGVFGEVPECGNYGTGSGNQGYTSPFANASPEMGGQKPTMAGNAAGDQKPPRKSGVNVGILIALVVLIVALIGAAVWFMLNRERFMGSDVPSSVEEIENSAVPEPDSNREEATVTAAPAEVSAPVQNQLYYVTGVADTIKVRADATANGKVLTKLENGNTVTVEDKNSDPYWKIYIEAEEITGYIDRHYLTTEAAAVTDPTTYYVVNTPAYLSVVDSTSSDYKELERMNNGSTLTVLAKPAGDFWYVYANGSKIYGYVLSSYLSTTAPTPSPSAAPAQTNSSQRVFGAGSPPSSYQGVYTTSVAKGYLALRNAKSFDSSNELGELYNGDQVYAIDTSETYWYVYAPSLGMYGYVNSDYLQSGTAGRRASSTGPSGSTLYYASVSSGYLALRTEKSYDEANEIGPIYNGEEVWVIDSSTGTYWYVYSPTLDAYGYVNSNYLS